LIIYFDLVFTILSHCEKKNLDIGLTFDFIKTIFFFFYLQKLKNKGNKIQSEGKMEPCFNLKLIIQLLLSEKILEIFLNFHYGHLV
jgi:hypothetical protein